MILSLLNAYKPTKLSLRAKLILSSMLACCVGILFAFVFLQSIYHFGLEGERHPSSGPLFDSFEIWHLGLAVLMSSLLAWGLSLTFTKHLSASISSLELGLLSFKDNDFSITISTSTKDVQLAKLAQLYNEVAMSLREERQYIYQRELLLDRVLQSSPSVMLLLDDKQHVIYANVAAQHFFHQGKSLNGLTLSDLLNLGSDELKAALTQPKEGIFTFKKSPTESNDHGEPESSEDELWHLSRGHFLLNGQYHHLILLKQMTQELNRQEVEVWKKVIRIISHELNNSLAPISSMVNSGRLITKGADDPKLKMIFDTIEDRTQHLSQFIDDYAHFARLSLPNKRLIDWPKLIDQLKLQYSFTFQGELPRMAVHLDLVQMEQVLLNLLKNAHESGSLRDKITLRMGLAVKAGVTGISLAIEDEGAGMSAEVLKQALLPFYSTKQAGTGLGLPLSREIVEAHGGVINLKNRDSKGLSVTLWLPVH